MKCINRVRELEVAGLSVLRGSAITGRDGDTSATATPWREALVRKQGVGDIDRDRG